MPRMTKHDYREPGSFERVVEAAYDLADADTSELADVAYQRARARLRAAAVCYARRVLAERQR